MRVYQTKKTTHEVFTEQKQIALSLLGNGLYYYTVSQCQIKLVEASSLPV